MHRIRIQLNATTIVAIVALVFAMTGGAFAVTGHSAAKKKAKSKLVITNTKQISRKVLAQLKGAKGPAGPTGPQGPAGLPGKDGANGTNGAPGESVGISDVKVGEAACAKLGGAKFTVGAKEGFACNGKEGKEGSPWTDKSKLPHGASETGLWAVQPAAEGETWLPISFDVQLPGELDETHVHYVTAAEVSGHTAPAACQGSFSEPMAEEGALCVYERFSFNLELTPAPAIRKLSTTSPFGVLGANVAGAIITLKFTSATPRFADGSWAVTAE